MIVAGQAGIWSDRPLFLSGRWLFGGYTEKRRVIICIQSAMLKYERYYPDHQTAKVFNDLLEFRTLCDTYYDRQLNNWLHKYVYKRKYKDQVGYRLRQAYESGKIKNESEFKEVLGNVLSDSEEIR